MQERVDPPLPDPAPAPGPTVDPAPGAAPAAVPPLSGPAPVPDHPGPYGTPPLEPRPTRNRAQIVVLAVIGAVLVLGALAFGALGLRSLTEDAEPSDKQVAQQTTEAPDNTTRVIAAEDGLTLTLPEDWEQMPTSPKELQEWAEDAAEANPQLAKLLESSRSTQALNNMTMMGVYTGTQGEATFQYFMVAKTPGPLPELTDETAAQVAKVMSAQPGMSSVFPELTTVAGAQAIRLTGSMALKDPDGEDLTNYVTTYMVPSERAGGFVVSFYSDVEGDPRGDIAKIMKSFDPAYDG